MKVWTHLFILMILTALASCTEQISEEIQNEATSTPSSGSGSIDLTTSSIRVVNKKDPLMSFIMHKSGSLAEACELKSPSGGFDAADYANNDPDTVVDCILDVEEYDLFFEGMEIDIQVDAGLCEYVQYTPFKYFQWQPGITTRTVYQIECDDFCETDVATSALCGNSYATSPGGSSLSYTNQITDLDKEALCTFDYTDREYLDKNGPNCDEGDINTIVITLSPDDPDVPTTCESAPGVGYVEAADAVETECGGDLTACYGGGSFPDVLPNDKTSLITQNLALASKEIPVTVDSPFSKDFITNLSIANFSRVCSSTSNTKFNSDFDVALVTILGDEVETMTSTANFNPIPVDLEDDGVIDHYILASHPFDGIAQYSSARTDISPYYSIRCLDSAKDTKAQIRVFVREWDRTFTEDNLFLSRLSDVNQGVNARMDADGEQEPGKSWNNFLDWDDLLTDTDLDNLVDSNSNDGGGVLDPVFINNQCQDINTGYCYDNLLPGEDVAETNQTDCEAASVDHYWIPNQDSFPEFKE